MPTTPVERVRRICLSLPDAWEKISHGEPTFFGKKRSFAIYASATNHHGAGRPAVWCKSTHLTQDLLVREQPKRYFVPPYVGPSGWIGIWLDKRPSWTDVEARLREAFELANKK